MKNAYTNLLFCLLLTSVGFAQNIDKEKLDKYFNTIDSNNKFMGSVVVAKKGRVIYSKTIGYADIEKNIKATENTKYRIGSISKTFTAVLIMKAVELGKIKLNQSIHRFFPTVKNAKKITVSNLLNHRSGIPNFTSKSDYLTWNTEFKSEKEMIKLIAESGSDFEPGSKAAYSNSNYVLLTYILEKTFKKNYNELLEEHILQPLELNDTYLGKKINTENNECKSYKYIGSWKEEAETDISIPLGAGGIVSSAKDLTKFIEGLFSEKIIQKEQLTMMTTLKDNYGMGLFQFPFDEKKAWGHTGGIDGFTSVLGFFPDDSISYALLSNGTNYNNNDISITVLSAIYEKPFTIPEFKYFEINSSDLDKYLGEYSSAQLPIKINITKEGKTLIAQATGQPSFSLEAIEKDKFKFEQAGIVLEFIPSDDTMILNQGGGKFSFTKN